MGTANLFGLLGDQESDELLRTAIEAGFRWFDTAPSYGHGRSEPAVGRLLSAEPGLRVTTKVGLAATPASSRPVRVVKALARQLPAQLQNRLRRAGQLAGQARFSSSDVCASIDQSVRRLGHIDRLMLHEVAPGDITQELLAELQRYLSRGDVGAVGVATANHLSVDCLNCAPDIFSAAHIAVGPWALEVSLPHYVTHRVGHGLFGSGGAELRVLEQRLRADASLGAAWQAATSGTRWAGPKGMADALVDRAATLDLTDVIIATSRPDRLASLHAQVSGATPLGPQLLAIIERLRSSSQPVGDQACEPGAPI